MRTILNSLLFIVFCSMLFACTDPFTLQSTTEVTKARIAADAAIRVAQEQAEASKYSSLQGTIQTNMIVSILPWLLLVICATAIIGLVVNWQGRIWYARTTQPTQPMLPALPELNRLRSLAKRQGYMIVESDNELLVYNQQRQLVGRKLLHD